MMRALAVLLAIAMVGGAYYLRTEVLEADDGPPGQPGSGGGSGTPVAEGAPEGDVVLEVACDATLAEACPAGAQRLDVDGLLDAFADPAASFDVLVAPRIVADMVVGSQRSRVAFAEDPTVVATTPLVLAVPQSRAAELQEGCGGALTWSCTSAAVADGALRPALADPGSESDGITALAALAGGYLADAGSPYNLTGFQTTGFLGWLDAVEQEVIVAAAPVEDLIRFGGAQNDSALVTEAEALRAVDRAAQNLPALRRPEPLVHLDVVLAVVEGADADAAGQLAEGVGEALRAARWRGADGAPLDTPDGVDPGPPLGEDDGLPSGGVLVALLDRWSS